MKTRIVVLISFAFSFGLLIVGTGNSVVLAAQTPADCSGMVAYVDAYHQVGVDYMAALEGLDTSQMETWTATEFQQAQTALDTALAGIEALHPPAIAEPLQDKATESLQLFQALLTAIESDGMLAALPYIDKMQIATAELDAIALPLEEHCQVAILDNDDDGVPEIGPGATTSAQPGIDSSAPLGDYANPYPVGSAQTTVDGWTIRVDAVTPDGTQQVLSENSFNEEPKAGHQFFIATITATYAGQGAESFDGNFRLRVLGANDAIYTAFGNSCGVTPNEWDEHIVVSQGESVTGNLCWSVPSEELAYLRMFDLQTRKAGISMYWSLGQEPRR